VTTTAQSNEITIVPAAEMADIIKLDQAARSASRELLAASMAGNEMAKGLIMARSIQVLRSLLTSAVMRDIMQLMDNPLGFKTDRRPGTKKDGKDVPPYNEAQVRDVMIQALIKGLRPTGNEVNIIAGQLYVTKEGYDRLVNELPGVTDLRIEVGIPKTSNGGAVVSARASWKLNARPSQLVCEGEYAIPIRVNEAMGADAIQGKATSKVLRRIHKIITNMDIGGDDDETPIDQTKIVDGTAKRVTESKPS
jgi:hypothetical protein